MIKYKIDVIKELSKRGYTQSRLRSEKILPGQTLINLRYGKSITLDTLNKICLITRLQPGDILEVVATDEEKIKYF